MRQQSIRHAPLRYLHRRIAYADFRRVAPANPARIDAVFRPKQNKVITHDNLNTLASYSSPSSPTTRI
jgi:hypothetical protein